MRINKLKADAHIEQEGEHQHVKKPVPVSLDHGLDTFKISDFLFEHVRNNNFIIQLFDVNEENLKNLRNISQNFQTQPGEQHLPALPQEVDLEKKERMEYMIGNIVLNTRIKKLKEENSNYRKRLDECQKGSSNQSYSSNGMHKKKRKRKLKNEVVRNFKCSYPGCSKSYGSDNSLNQHVKIKHSEFWKKTKYSNMNDFQREVYLEKEEPCIYLEKEE